MQVWFKNRRAKFRQQQKAPGNQEEKEDSPTKSEPEAAKPVSAVTYPEPAGEGSPLSANSSHSSGYSTDLTNISKTVEESNEKLIEEAVKSPKMTEPAEAAPTTFEQISFGIPAEIEESVDSSSDSVGSSSPVVQGTSSPILNADIEEIPKPEEKPETVNNEVRC